MNSKLIQATVRQPNHLVKVERSNTEQRVLKTIQMVLVLVPTLRDLVEWLWPLIV
ncbi:hypothetical protein M2A_3130 [Tepidicaulis marinus]|uniref:Uncharacterized protein n=1 Tax=Tepidicaulis marinus TaxID=1333998 RepID=A0A081BF13_9HYPH|nr:hypothetical protein M2A_3130 [Tepidicaulis marinus]